MQPALPTLDDAVPSGDARMRPATPSPPTAAGRLVIRPSRGWRALNLAELWRYRELLWYLGLRDIQVRYKQTLLGALWVIMQPLSTMVVFTIFFGRLGGMDKRVAADVPYALFVLAGLLPWQMFAYVLSQASRSLVQNRLLITKVYFPRLIAPLSPLLCALLDFTIGFACFLALLPWFGYYPSWPVLALPLFLALALLTSLAAGVWLAAVNAIYRDVEHTLTFLIQIWLFVSPVAYPSSIVPQAWRWLYYLNPMAGVIDGFRWALLPGVEFPGPVLALSALVSAALFIGGLFYFRRVEQYFADVV
jgi:lipopolysaccharide transport system permease protein